MRRVSDASCDEVPASRGLGHTRERESAACDEIPGPRRPIQKLPDRRTVRHPPHRHRERADPPSDYPPGPPAAACAATAAATAGATSRLNTDGMM
jgi:hypothetical protein